MHVKKIKVATNSNVPITKTNNYIVTNKIPKEIQFLIGFEVLVGINKLSAIFNSKIFLFLSNIYITWLIVSVVFFRITTNVHSATQFVLNINVSFEYLVLCVSALSKNKLLRTFFGDLQLIDDISYSNRRFIFGFILILCYDIMEFIFNNTYLYVPTLGYWSRFAIFISLLAHDIEVLFFMLMLIMILRRAERLRARVTEVFDIDKNLNSETEDMGSTQINSVVITFYNEYNLLHNCSHYLNKLISLPVCTCFSTQYSKY